MSFQNKDIEVLNEMGSGTSVKIEKKRAHQSSMDASERELFSNKKQVVQFASNTPIATPIATPASMNTSNFQPVQVHLGDSSSAPKPISTFSFGDKYSPWNTFPAHVKDLLSSGLLDGVSVKYISSSWEKTLKGVIKDNGYLCGCDDCKLSKNQNVICALEFERHAASKSGHANKHIYFESGKTIYAAVQELKKTPPERLFEAIQNIVGSPINPKNFQTFKDEYGCAPGQEAAQ